MICKSDYVELDGANSEAGSQTATGSDSQALSASHNGHVVNDVTEQAKLFKSLVAYIIIYLYCINTVKCVVDFTMNYIVINMLFIVALVVIVVPCYIL